MNNVLILEDTESWQQIFQREMSKLGLESWPARTLDEARYALDRVAFSAAIIDLALDPEDEQNSDGKTVMELLALTDDSTQCVVVTGKGDRDFALARELIKTLGAYDALEKNPAPRSEDYRRIIGGAVAKHLEELESTGRSGDDIYGQIRGRMDASIFDFNVLLVARPRGGPVALHDFQDELFRPLWPIRLLADGRNARIDKQSGVVSSEYWSRGLGKAVWVGYAIDGADSDVEERISSAAPGDVVSEGPLSTVVQAGMRGLVFQTEAPRDRFQV